MDKNWVWWKWRRRSGYGEGWLRLIDGILGFSLQIIFLDFLSLRLFELRLFNFRLYANSFSFRFSIERSVQWSYKIEIICSISLKTRDFPDAQACTQACASVFWVIKSFTFKFQKFFLFLFLIYHADLTRCRLLGNLNHWGWHLLSKI